MNDPSRLWIIYDNKIVNKNSQSLLISLAA